MKGSMSRKFQVVGHKMVGIIMLMESQLEGLQRFKGAVIILMSIQEDYVRKHNGQKKMERDITATQRESYIRTR